MQQVRVRPIACANAVGMPTAPCARALSVPVAKNTFATYLLGVAFDQVPLPPAGIFRPVVSRFLPTHSSEQADQRVRPQGIGVHADSESAFEWYRKAAELGHPRAQLCVGLKTAAYTAYVDPRVVFWLRNPDRTVACRTGSGSGLGMAWRWR